jgi:uncharacterized pyridoxamine 5'-phosphate oxidase family protein
MWKNNFKEGKELLLATCFEDVPNANVVISLGFIDDKLLIADSQMNQTLKNLKSNNKICIVSKYIRLKGKVEIFSSGKYFDLCNEKDKEYPTKNAILVTVEEVFDLDKVKLVE